MTGFSTNDFTGNTVFYLKEWNETKFTGTVMVLAIQSVTKNTNHYEYLLSKILRHARKALPVSVTELRKP